MLDGHVIADGNRLSGRQPVTALDVGADTQQNNRPLLEYFTDLIYACLQVNKLNRPALISKYQNSLMIFYRYISKY